MTSEIDYISAHQKCCDDFIDLYLATYAETQSHPTALQEAVCVAAAADLRDKRSQAATSMQNLRRRIEALEAKPGLPQTKDDGTRFRCAHCDYVTPSRDISLLVGHVAVSHPDQMFYCAGRGTPPMRSPLTGNGRDCWVKEPNGDLTCVHCGSMSEETFVDIVTRFVAGEEGYSFEPSTKNYKIYAHRPGVSSAGQGGIKFYGWHVDRTQSSETLKAREQLEKQAQIKASERFRVELTTAQSKGQQS